MRETTRARQAYNDYLAMGADRSLRKLLAHYRQRSDNGIAVPTLRFRTLADWSRLHDWDGRLRAVAEAERQAIVARGITEKQNRIDAANERWQALRDGVKAWASQYRHAPGGAKSGYYARQVKLVKVYAEYRAADNGKMELVPLGPQVEVEEWVLDSALLRELRELEKQVAIELGQWTEKRENTLDATEAFIRALQEFGRGDT